MRKIRVRGLGGEDKAIVGSYLRKGDRLWSCLPFMRPLCGVIRDRCGLGERVVRGGMGYGGAREQGGEDGVMIY